MCPPWIARGPQRGPNGALSGQREAVFHDVSVQGCGNPRYRRPEPSGSSSA